MTDRSQILAPLPDERWPPALAGQVDGKVLNIHRLIAHNPALMQAYAPLRNYIVRGGSLTPRQRELLILRTAHNMGSAYEWRHHVVRGRAVGLADAEIAATRTGPDGPRWSDDERALLRAADEIHRTQLLSVETTVALQSQLGDDGLLDAIFIVHIYLLMGTLLNSFDVPLENSIAEVD